MSGTWGINRVAEKIRDPFPLVNERVNNWKKMFLKASSRIGIYKSIIDGPQRRQFWRKSGRFISDWIPKKLQLKNSPRSYHINVECSFSTYKRILDDRRHNLLDINIDCCKFYKFSD